MKTIKDLSPFSFHMSYVEPVRGIKANGREIIKRPSYLTVSGILYINSSVFIANIELSLSQEA